jgi:hypothetical protein
MATSTPCALPMPTPSYTPSAPTRTLMLSVFVLAYALSCGLPALYLEGQASEWRGFYLLVVGVMGFEHQQFAWLGNLAAVAALMACMNGGVKRARFFGAIALGLGLSTLTLFGQVIHLGGHDLNIVRVTSLGPGYYFWLLAIASPAFLSFLPMEQRNEPTEEVAAADDPPEF